MSERGLLADCTETGWLRVVRLTNDPTQFLGAKHQLLEYPDRWAFRHLCDRGERGTIICAPSLANHTVTETAAGVTVRASILCGDCGTHGYVTDSVWKSV